ncbi:MAG TPA: hypothetical protein VHB49_10190 [Bradyrhizobium sp.]|nr:hypothetical protein [Bradyrhizobium sp.]
MDTKKRKTARAKHPKGILRPVQGAGPEAGARHRRQAAKIELEKPESVSRAAAKKF